jgi:glycosyltransferase involved in cell wall biosynthesis
MNSKNLVSVIIPYYNGGKYIDKTIKSVLDQAYKEFEIIIVDDGSTDTFTKQYLSQLDHSKIKVFYKGNGGVASARNYAILKSQGEYILPLDADDLIAKDYLELAVDILNQNSAVKLVTCNVEYFGYRKGFMQSQEFSIEKLLAKNLFVVSSVFRRMDYDKTKGFNMNMKEGFEDWDFWISLLGDGGEVHNIDKTCFYYRSHKGSRNFLMGGRAFKKMRYQIYENHAELYHRYFINPTDCFEYELVKNSMEYKVGKMILRPFRYFQKFT